MAFQFSVAVLFVTDEELNPLGILQGGAGVAKFADPENVLVFQPPQSDCTWNS